MKKDLKIWTLSKLLDWSIEYLLGKGIEDARSSVEWMLCHVLSCSRMDLYLKFDRPMTPDELDRYRPMLIACGSGRPVQQIIGESEFFGIRLLVNDKVLAPRPETELLVETVLEELKTREAQEPGTGGDGESRVIETAEETELADGISETGAEKKVRPKGRISICDIGSGSGAIAIALGMHIPNSDITALEISAAAAEVLSRNVKFHNLNKRIHIVREDVFNWQNGRRYDIIVSNPPYIAEQEMAGLDRRVSHYEPYMALSDGGDGLKFYRFYAEKLRAWLNPGAFAVLEFGGDSQEKAVKELFGDYSAVQIVRDYQGQARHLKVTL